VSAGPKIRGLPGKDTQTSSSVVKTGKVRNIQKAELNLILAKNMETKVLEGKRKLKEEKRFREASKDRNRAIWERTENPVKC